MIESKIMLQKKCPCCGEKFNSLNYHLKTRVLPCQDKENYKCLQCLRCNNQIAKEITVRQSHIVAILTIIGAWLFAESVRYIFDIWSQLDRLIANVPFMLIFFILVYTINIYYRKLECYSDDKNHTYNNCIDDDADINNIHGIFNKKEKVVIGDIYKIVALAIGFLALVIVGLVFYVLLK